MQECYLHAFKDLMDAMLSGIESLRRRRVHSEDAFDSMRLKNSRSGYLSRVTTLCRAAEVLLNDSKNVNGLEEVIGNRGSFLSL